LPAEQKSSIGGFFDVVEDVFAEFVVEADVISGPQRIPFGRDFPNPSVVEVVVIRFFAESTGDVSASIAESNEG